MASKDRQKSVDISVQELLQNQREKWENSLKHILDSKFRHFSEGILSDIRTLRNEMHEVHAKTSKLEHSITAALQECSKAKQSVNELEHIVNDIAATFEEKIDRLEIVQRKNNIKLFNVQRHGSNENPEQCVAAVLSVLEGTVPDKVWSRTNIVEAYRLGRYNDNRGRPPPVIVKFATLTDKILVLTAGRRALREKGVTVAADLTDKQRQIIQEHRSQGMYAYYKGNRLVVEEARNEQISNRQRHRQHDNSHDQNFNTSYNNGSRRRGQSTRTDQPQQAASQSGYSASHSLPSEFRSTSDRTVGNYSNDWDSQSFYWSGVDQQQYQQYQYQYVPDVWSMHQFPSLPLQRNSNLIALNTNSRNDVAGRPILQTMNSTDDVNKRTNDVNKRTEHMTNPQTNNANTMNNQTEELTEQPPIDEDNYPDTLSEQIADTCAVEDDHDESRKLHKQDILLEHEITEDSEFLLTIDNSTSHDESVDKTNARLENTELHEDSVVSEDNPPCTDIDDKGSEVCDRQTDTTVTHRQVTRTADSVKVTCSDQPSTGNTSSVTPGDSPSVVKNAARGGPSTRQRSASCTSTSKRQTTLHETTRKHTKPTKK